MKEQEALLEEQTTLELKETLQEKTSQIRSICLYPKFISGKVCFVGLESVCQDLIDSIDSPEEWEASYNNLPIGISEKVTFLFFNRLVTTFADLEKVLNEYPIKWYKQIVIANESKLARIVRTKNELIEILQVLPIIKDFVLQNRVLKAFSNQLLELIKSDKDLEVILEKFYNNYSIQIGIVEAIEPNLSTIIKSVKSLGSILENFQEEAPMLQKNIIAAYAPNLTPNTFTELLNLLSEKPVLQEKVIETLNNKKNLKRLCKGVKGEVLHIVRHDIVLCQIVEKATRSRVTQFFKQLTKSCLRPDAEVASMPYIEQRPGLY